MGTITHIEKAAGFGLRSLPYEGFLMPTHRPDRLLLINLPLGGSGTIAQVLVHVLCEEPSELTVVLDDSHMPAVSRRFIGQRSVPAIYAPVDMGTLTAYLEEHEEAVHDLLAVGGAAFSALTLARAVRAMTADGIGAAEALGLSLEQSAAVRNMQQCQERAVMNMLST